MFLKALAPFLSHLTPGNTPPPLPPGPCATHNLILSYQICLCIPTDVSPSVVVTRLDQVPDQNETECLYTL